jgi:hypothetical protein
MSTTAAHGLPIPRLLAESSGNFWLVQILDQVFDKMALVRLRTLQHNPRVLDICSEHRRIYEAICDRNSIAANQAIQFHQILRYVWKPPSFMRGRKNELAALAAFILIVDRIEGWNKP